MATPLSDILDSSIDIEPEKVPEEIPAEPTGEPEAEAQPEPTAEQLAKESEAAPAETAPPAVDVQQQLTDLQGQVKAFQRKAEDEVRKRQTVEKQVERADAYTEPDKAIQQAVDEARNETWSAIRLMQENTARAAHEDYDEKFTLFEKMAQNNPTLLSQANNEFDPAMFIYRTASNHAKLEEMGDLGTFEDRIRADERAKAQAEFDTGQKAKTEQAITDAIPQTLSGATAAGGTGAKTYSGPTPLNKIIGNR